MRMLRGHGAPLRILQTLALTTYSVNVIGERVPGGKALKIGPGKRPGPRSAFRRTMGCWIDHCVSVINKREIWEDGLHW